jgi:hypothetical protein
MDRDKTRPLALYDANMGHPFRQSLPIEIVQIARKEHGLQIAASSKKHWLGEDASLFLLSFLSFFTTFYMFII